MYRAIDESDGHVNVTFAYVAYIKSSFFTNLSATTYFQRPIGNSMLKNTLKSDSKNKSFITPTHSGIINFSVVSQVKTVKSFKNYLIISHRAGQFIGHEIVQMH